MIPASGARSPSLSGAACQATFLSPGQTAILSYPMAKKQQPAPSARRAVFPGQFDPITKGHLDVIRRGVRLFDELIVAVGNNPGKRGLFSHDERADMIRKLLHDEARVRVEKYSGLTVDFVKQCGALAILRGIRDVSDLRYEFQLAMANRTVGGIETVFIMTGEHFALTSSSLIRQVVALGGDLRQLKAILPDIVIRKLQTKQRTLNLADFPEHD